VRPQAALQVRCRCLVVVGIDGRVRPGEAFMVIASRLKLPGTEMGLFAGFFVALTGGRSLWGS